MLYLILVPILVSLYVWYNRTADQISQPDDLPQLDRPVVTLVLITICISTFVMQHFAFASRAAAIAMEYGSIPAVLTGRVPPDSELAALGFSRTHELLTLFTSAFLHGGFFHIFGNMIFLWVFGRHFDDLMNWYFYLALVVVCTLSSSLASVIAEPARTTPTIGASGFIAGLMGAYLVLFPKAKLYQYWRVPLLMRPITFALPAWAYLLVWMGLQITYFSMGGERKYSIAYSAHIVGFVTGAALAWMLNKAGAIASYAPEVAVGTKTS